MTKDADHLQLVLFRRLDLVVREHESDGVAIELALEEENSQEKSSNEASRSREHGANAGEATIYE
jgi:hypothetical protein